MNAPIRDYLLGLQNRICAMLEEEDGEARFEGEELARPGGGVSRPRVLSEGSVIERAAVNFTHTQGANMPEAATERRPELAGRRYFFSNFIAKKWFQNKKINKLLHCYLLRI